MRYVNGMVLSAFFLIVPHAGWAQSLDDHGAPTSPDSAMYTLDDIYNRLDTGAAGAKRGGPFTEPSAAPAPTGPSLDNIMGKAPAVDDANGASAADVLTGKTFWGVLSGGGWGLKTGSLATQTPDNTTVSQPAGYYEEFNLSTVDTDLAAGNIRSGVSIFGVAGDGNVVDTSSGDAAAGDMLAGKKAWVDGAEVNGTAAAGANFIGGDGLKTFTVPDGLYTGSKTATANDADLTGPNIASGIQIFGVTGTAVVATGDAAAADVLTGKTFSNAGGAGISGTMTSVGQQNVTPGTSAQTINQGYHNGTGTVAGDANLVTGNIRSGVSIFSVSGKTEVVDTTEGASAVVAERMKTGDVGFVNGAKITGTGTKTLSGDNDTVNAGYYESTTLGAVDTDLTAVNIKKDVQIFGVTGTYPLAGVAKTGQTPTVPLNPAPAGSDGALQKGVAWLSPRFTDNSDGTVTDNLTGVIWLKNANCDGTKTWDNALAFCNALQSGQCGLTDESSAGEWRLPNVMELLSLIDWRYYEPALSNALGTGKWSSEDAFADVQSHSSGYYWSSTTGAHATGGAWFVSLYNGYKNSPGKGNEYYVWPVRGGQ